MLAPASSVVTKDVPAAVVVVVVGGTNVVVVVVHVLRHDVTEA
jgi:hypothetical protein